ncbi:hypothetical protein [Nocardia amamiensis]|uniref:hypothetical protein n=1 Tax=Nocardia amamiensis TaxID=404578 RepID=UPI000829AA19|nr:hypothetical protein [Nocardia amamiensis]
MHFIPESMLGMAQAIDPAVAATQGHATQIAGAGFEPTHAGQDYVDQGRRLAAGIEGIVTMLQSWSEASDAAAAALRQAVTMNVTTDQENSAQITAATDQLGPA